MRNFLSLLGVISLAALSAAQLLACSDPVGPAPASSEPVIIGVTMGLSGDLATITQPQEMRQAVRLAERHINASGGILGGRRVLFDIVDDASSKDVSEGSGVLKRAFDGLFERKALGAIGPVGSGQISALGPLFGAQQRPVISPSATAESLTATDSYSGYFFRTAPSDARQVKVLVDILKRGRTGTDTDGSACRKLGIFYTDTAYSRGLQAGLQAAWREQSGANTVESVEPPADNSNTNFAPAVAKMRAFVPTCLAVLSYQGAASSFLRTLAGTEPTLFTNLNVRVGSEALYSDEFVAAANQGISGTTPKPAELFWGAAPVPDRARSAYLDWLSVLSASDAKTAADSSAKFYFTSTYDAALLMALASHQSKGQGGDALRLALRSVSSGGDLLNPLQLPELLRKISDGLDVDYDGASGDCDFDAKGDVATGFQVWQVSNNALVTKRTLSAKDLAK